VDHVRDTILERVRSDPSSPALVVLELSATLYVDTHSSHMLAELGEDLAVMGVRVRVVEARSSVRDCLRGEGVDEKLGKVNRFTSVDDAIEEGSAG
jgi:MFS superfamily sulfate permease-like transporter